MCSTSPIQGPDVAKLRTEKTKVSVVGEFIDQKRNTCQSAPPIQEQGRAHVHMRVLLLMATRKTYIDNAGNLVGPRKMNICRMKILMKKLKVWLTMVK